MTMARLAIFLLGSLITTSVQAQTQTQTTPSLAIDRMSIAYGQCVGKIEQLVDRIAELEKKLAKKDKSEVEK